MTLPQPRLLHWKSLVVPVTFLPARRGTWSIAAVDREVRLICLHSAECAESAKAAESLQQWAAGSQSPLASWHFAVDSDSITQSVEVHDLAWHAGPINGYSVGIEQAGRASQTREQWLDFYSSKVLAQTAQLIALIAGLYDLPIEHCLNPAAYGARGVCTHADVTRAFSIRGGHSDPGPNYPLEDVLTMARNIQLEAVS
jgi:N-acetyl-anhydromuramyl-L-alanine amidase AmpD